MSEITTVGLDLAKRVVSLCGEDAMGRVVVQRTLRREAVLAWFVQRPPCLVGMEACASAHWFARELTALGHTARIIAPEFVRPFRLSGKNDANDAAAICAAVRQPQLRFVTVKSARAAGAAGGASAAPGLAGRTHCGHQSPAWAAGRVRSGLSEQCARSIGRERAPLWPTRRCRRHCGAGWRGSSSTCANSTAHLADCDREIAQDVRDDPRAQRAGPLERCRRAHRQRGRGDGGRCAPVPLRPPVRGVAGDHAATILDRRQTPARPHHAPWRHLPAFAAGAGCTLGVAGGTARGAAATNATSSMDRRHLRAHRLPQDLVAIANKHARLLWVLLTRDEPLRAHAAMN